LDGNPRGIAIGDRGGMRMGQAIGSTNRLGEAPRDRPAHYHAVLVTSYQQLGIDAETAITPEQAGRPQFLVNHRNPIRELT
jgi:hypothetical protein